MRTSDFDYHLPTEFIAQTPIEPRHNARLLVMARDTGTVEHAHFYELGRFLDPGDVLVLNETRVIPARLFAHKEASGGRVELLLLRRAGENTWEALVGGKGLREGVRLRVENGPPAEVAAVLESSRRLVRFAEPIEPYLSRAGHVPLPPYIHTALADPERYQTVYSKEPGSAAAPTAGLHFTPQLLGELRDRGIRTAPVTLHVGLDTFAPVDEDDPAEHTIHSEWCQVTPAAAAEINQARRDGRRIVAVGTTSVRTLETASLAAAGQAAASLAAGGRAVAFAVAAYEGPTSLFILPGHRFRAVDALLTNFHLPRSTLLMLVSAFAGRERILAAYETAKQEGYRFYSFGDAMLIL